jgi:hypothetical protein
MRYAARSTSDGTSPSERTARPGARWPGSAPPAPAGRPARPTGAAARRALLQRVDLGPQPVQRLPAHGADALERRPGPGRVPVEHAQRDTGLHRDDGEAVPGHVVYLLRQPQPLLGHRPPGLRRPHLGRRVAAGPDRHPDRRRHDHPGRPGRDLGHCTDAAQHVDEPITRRWPPVAPPPPPASGADGRRIAVPSVSTASAIMMGRRGNPKPRYATVAPAPTANVHSGQRRQTGSAGRSRP